MIEEQEGQPLTRLSFVLQLARATITTSPSTVNMSRPKPPCTESNLAVYWLIKPPQRGTERHLHMTNQFLQATGWWHHWKTILLKWDVEMWFKAKLLQQTFEMALQAKNPTLQPIYKTPTTAATCCKSLSFSVFQSLNGAYASTWTPFLVTGAPTPNWHYFLHRYCQLSAAHIFLSFVLAAG